MEWGKVERGGVGRIGEEGVGNELGCVELSTVHFS